MKIYHVIMFLPLLAIISGCAGVSQAQLDTAMARIDTRSAECTKGELTRKNALKRRKCVDTAMTEELIAVKYPYMSIIYDALAKGQDDAVDYAEGRISKAKYNAKGEQIMATMRREEQAAIQADEQRRAIAIQNFQNSLNQLQAQENARIEQQIMMNNSMRSQTTTTNCHLMGSYMNCTSF